MASMDATAFVQELETFKAERLSAIVGAGRTSLADGAPGDATKMLQVALANEIQRQRAGGGVDAEHDGD